MYKRVRLNESQLTKIIKESVKRILRENEEPKFEIGQEHLGGIVFHVDESGEHGLVAAKQDYPKLLSWYDAMKLFKRNQWRLPTKEELNLLYEQKDIVGGFVSDYYWSSSEGGSVGAWRQFFENGNQYYNLKNNTSYVRAVRAF